MAPAHSTSNILADIFDFFGLPRELRDLVYTEILLGEGESHPRTHQKLLSRAIHAPPTALLKLNRQFKQELLDQAHKITMLVCQDLCMGYEIETLPYIPPNCLRVQQLRLDLFISDCDDCECPDESQYFCEKDMDLHANWLSNILSIMPGLHTIEADIHVTEKAADADHENMVSQPGQERVRPIVSILTSKAALRIRLLTIAQPPDDDASGYDQASEKCLKTWVCPRNTPEGC